jgi:carboxylesterase
VKGSKIGVLLVHGLCGTPSEMRFIANGLAKDGYTVHCPQLAGHCGSSESLKSSTWQDWDASTERALEELRAHYETIVVGGRSTGAILSLLLAADHPDDVQGLALFAPTLWINGWNIPWYIQLLNLVHSKAVANLWNFPDNFPHGIKDPRIRKFFVEALFSGQESDAGLQHTPGGAVLEHGWLVKQVMEKVNSIVQPALILHPKGDDLANINNSLQRNMRGTVELAALDDCYHNVTIDRQRDVVLARTSEFVNRIATRRRWDQAKLEETFCFQ